MKKTEFFSLPIAPARTDLWKMLAKDTRPIIVYGTGNGADKLAMKLSSIGREVSDYFVSDAFARGQVFRGKSVGTYEEIRKKYSSCVILVAFGSRDKETLDDIYRLASVEEVYIPDIPLYGDAYFDAAYYNAHYTELEDVYHLLADRRSKMLFSSIVWYKLTGLPDALRAVCDKPDAFADILNCRSYHHTVDAGAYTGDTAESLIAYTPEIVSITALEPDPKSYRKLIATAGKLLDRVTILPYHAYASDEPGNVELASSGNRNSGVASPSHEHKKVVVPAVRIDDLVKETPIDFIKYDVEGAEMKALLGSRETISQNFPDLAVSVYHRSEDLFSIPLWIDRTFRGYRFHLRRSDCVPAWEINLYATAENPPTRVSSPLTEDFSALLRKYLALTEKYQDEATPVEPKSDLIEPKHTNRVGVRKLGYIAHIKAEIAVRDSYREETENILLATNTNRTYTADTMAAHLFVREENGAIYMGSASTRNHSWIYDERRVNLSADSVLDRTFFFTEKGEDDWFCPKPTSAPVERIHLHVTFEKYVSIGEDQ